MPSPYNTTDLDPAGTFERHVYHRDQFAHYLRWTHVVRLARERRPIPTVVDFGCGKASAFEVMYRNRLQPTAYVGLDIRESALEQAQGRFGHVTGFGLLHEDLVKPSADLSVINGDLVICFEVLEHVGKQNARTFLDNLAACGAEGATYLLSTPNHDPAVGAAGNHTYDSGDGRGVAVQEHAFDETYAHLLDAGFRVDDIFGTFASQRDYLSALSPAQRVVRDQLKRYYDSELIAVMMAPIVPPHMARNALWVLSR